MLQSAGCPARVHSVLLSLVCQQARSLLEGSGRSASSGAGSLLSLEVCLRDTLQNDQCGTWWTCESAVGCPQSHNDHLVFSGKEVACILSVVIRTLLKPSPLPLFHYGLCFFKRDFM